ncbi:MAG: hypothetical protein ACI80V_002201 [Rhodothermales bacterium]|jgi:hypothetical protein
MSRRTMISMVALVVLGAMSVMQLRSDEPDSGAAAVAGSENTGAVEAAFAAHQNGVWVTGEGRVDRTLGDDTEGARHQRFVLELASGHTILISHNIDIAPRVTDLREGDDIKFHGQYEWNEQGGVVHWTHRDPQGRQDGGWLEHFGNRHR